jgi:hypothetical protein
MHSSTLSVTSARGGAGWLTPRPGRFTPGNETRYSLYRRLGGPKGRSGQVRNTSLLPGFHSQSQYQLSYRDPFKCGGNGDGGGGGSRGGGCGGRASDYVLLPLLVLSSQVGVLYEL